jgi:hypothetical protein
MNYSTAIFLVNKSVRAIAGIYEDDDNGKRPVPKQIFKTLDPSISAGDFVLVPTNTRHKMTVNKVVEVDVDVDFDNATPMAWVIGVVDRTEFERTTKMEEQAIATIKSAEKRRRQDELRAALLKDNPELQTLAIVDGTAMPAPETPPSAV